MPVLPIPLARRATATACASGSAHLDGAGRVSVCLPAHAMPNSGGPPGPDGGKPISGPARSSGVRPPLGLGRLRSRQRDWDKPRGSGRFKLDHPRCRFQPQHEDFRQHGTASLVRPFDVGDALPVQNRMLRPAVWARTCKHFIITVSSGFCRHVGGSPHNRPLCYAWRQNMAGCLPRGRDTGLKLGLNLLGDFPGD